MALSVALALAGLCPTQGLERRPPFATVQQPLPGPSEFPSYDHGVTMRGADLDGDGRDEALLTGMDGRIANLHVAADGWTIEPSYVQVLGLPNKIEAVDLDRDGALDLVVASDCGLQVLWNRGQGEFEAPHVLTAGNCMAAQGGDLDGDGALDLLASVFPPWNGSVSESWQKGGLLTFLGDGSRGFRQAESIGTTWYHELALGDWNEDGVLDAAASAWSSIAIYLGQGHGRLRLVDHVEDGAMMRMIARDLDGDGHQDLARLGYEEGLEPVLFGNGGGRFERGQPFWPPYGTIGPTLPLGYGLDAADCDGDRIHDLLLFHDQRPELVRGAAGKAFARSEPLPLSALTWAGAFADVDRDGIEDVVAHMPLFGESSQGEPIQGWANVLHGDGRGGWRDVRTARHDDSLTGDIVQRAQADLNGDGLPDWVELGGHKGGARVLLSDGHGGWFAPVDHREVAQLFDPCLGDVNGDGRPDLVGKCFMANAMATYPGDGAGGFGQPVLTEFPVGLYAQDYVLADLDADGCSDLVMEESAPMIGAVRIHLARGDGSFGPAMHIPGLRWVASIHPADLDVDGHLDLVVVQSPWLAAAWRVLVLPGLGGGRFGAEQVIDTVESWMPPVALADVDANGLLDIVLGSSRHGDSKYEIVAHLATAPNEFGRTLRSRAGTRPRQIAAGDFDSDGTLDLLAGNPGAQDVLLRGRGDGQFEGWTRLSSLGYLSAMADMDRDGDEDLVYATTVLLNRTR